MSAEWRESASPTFMTTSRCSRPSLVGAVGGSGLRQHRLWVRAGSCSIRRGTVVATHPTEGRRIEGVPPRPGLRPARGRAEPAARGPG
eukprot:13760127-Alexandrium_andersonii.AAC.1